MTVRQWVYTGFFFLVVSGFLLHFLFDWTGSFTPAGFILPVNESVWEHFKLGYWSIVFLALAEFCRIRNHIHNFFLAKLAGLLALEITIVAVYYGYMYLVGKDIIILDILSYVLGAVLCQVVTYKLYMHSPFSDMLNRASLAIFIALGILLGAATFYPPHADLFRDNSNRSYGIHREK